MFLLKLGLLLAMIASAWTVTVPHHNGPAANASTPAPKIYKDLEIYRQPGYFGKPIYVGPIPADDPAIYRLNISIDQHVLKDLHDRLHRAHFIPDSPDLRQMTDYWLHKYNWSAAQAKINSFSNYITQIEGLRLHFVHAQASPNATKVIPLLACHGWPGSPLDYYEAARLLTQPDADGLAFEIIIPSIPGFSFSEPPQKSGLSAIAVARIYTTLMRRLGLDQFLVHGGDWGNLIARNVALLFPDHIIGAHLFGNWDLLKIFASNEHPSSPSLLKFFTSEAPYYYLLGTQPDIFGAALIDSPVALAGLIFSKYISGSTSSDVPTLSVDHFFTTTMLYWTSGHAYATLRWYKENVHQASLINRILDHHKIRVPVGILNAPHQLIRLPRSAIVPHYEHLVQYTSAGKGGEYFAVEEPEVLVKDIRELVWKIIEQFPSIVTKNQVKKKKLGFWWIPLYVKSVKSVVDTVKKIG